MKTILIIIGLIVLVALIGGGVFWYLSGQPLYQPGMVSQAENLSAPLSPPPQPNGAQTWLVEPGIELAHFAAGQGRNVLIIHGGPGMPFSQPMTGLDTLTDQYQFHYYDQRGSGASTRPIDKFDSPNVYQNMQTLDKTLGLSAQIADIERIRQILGDEQLILVGHSWGAFLASLYAAEFPDHVAALILISPANMLVMPQPEADSDLFTSVRASLPADQQAEFDAFMEAYFDFNGLFKLSEAELVDMNDQFGEYYVQVIDAPDMPQQGRPGGWMVWAQYVSMGQRHDYRAALSPVDAPVLVIHGTDDLQSEAASQMYAEAFPNAEFVVIPDASHFSFEQQPEQFAEIVSTFLDTLQ
ncbi:MAG: alpha/beta hydrolase [Anaerolineales bacterium]|nr:alpha/beta hydrolase [Anaerolineales bacterium]